MYCIGLTGTIASGKSTVAAQFAALGIDVISADVIAKTIVQRGQPAYQQIMEHFGPSILATNGELNRTHLRHIIAEDAHARTWLESLLHPLIRQHIKHDIKLCQSPYCIIEIPLLTDKSAYPYLNRVLLIQAERSLQKARIMARDKTSQDHASAMLATTIADDNARLNIADDVLVNTESIASLQKKIILLHEQYLCEAKKIR